MFPLYDTTKRTTFPFVNYAIIIVNLIAFWFQIKAANPDAFINQYAFIPHAFNILNPTSYIPMITALFLHGSILHILSNMWFLHIFGDNVEDRLGHLQYLLFYLLGGMAASFAQYFLDPSTSIAMLGASGAISAVAGAYFVYYRHSSVKTLLPLFIIFTVVNIPVWLFLGYWFFIQLFSGIGSLGAVGAQNGGVAWFAHVGGFVFGYLYANFFGRKIPVSEAEVGEIVSS